MLQQFPEELYLAPHCLKLRSAVVHHILESHPRKVFCIDSLDMNYLEANKMKANINQKIYFFMCVKNLWIISRKNVSIEGGIQFKYLKAGNLHLSHNPRLPL